MKHKKLLISLTAVGSAILMLAIFLMVWFYGDRYKDFDANFSKEFSIPGLKDGAVPQGMGNCTAEYVIEGVGTPIKKSQQYFFITAYMVDGSPSRIYVTGEDTGYVGYVTMKNVDGSDYLGHCGGIATNGSYLWVTGESTVYVAKSSSSDYPDIANELITKAKLEEGSENKSVKFTSSFKANCGADFCFYYDNPNYTSVSYDRLYVGEFYRKGNWETDMSHRMTTPNGYYNTALVYEYNISTLEPYGLVKLSDSKLTEENKVPKIQRAISIPEKIQGLARVGNTLALSQSYGLANSHIFAFDWKKTTESENGKNFNELNEKNFAYEGVTTSNGVPYTVTDLKVYFADCNNSELLLKNYEIPSMSEGLCAAGNKVYVLFESAGKKYKTFVRERIKNVYSVRFRY